MANIIRYNVSQFLILKEKVTEERIEMFIKATENNLDKMKDSIDYLYKYFKEKHENKE